MNNLVKLWGASVLVLSLGACSGHKTPSFNSGQKIPSNTVSNNNISGFYEAFTTCEQTGANKTEQALFNRICGQHDIVFTRTGNKGVLRFNGALVNWDEMSQELLANNIDSWQNFYVSLYMKLDEGLGLKPNDTKEYPYTFDQVYANFGDSLSRYTLEQKSASHYIFEVHSSVEIEGSHLKVDTIVTLNIQLGHTPSADKIKGTIRIGQNSAVNFTAQGKPVHNQPLLGIK